MYKIVGADQKEYGPVAEDQVRQWISEGRANGQTIARLGDGPWKPLATFPEFALALGAAAPSQSPPSLSAPPLAQSPMSGMAPPPASGVAIAGLTSSIIGLFCCGPIFSTVGLVLSALALSQINQDPSRFGGRNVAIAGIALALVGYALFAVLVLSGLFRRGLKRFRRYV